MTYREVFTFKRLWILFGALLAVTFGALLLVGGRAFQEAPPLPATVAVVDGEASVTLFDADDIHGGRDVWRRLGGMQLGSVWGHGSYLAPDWTADVLHREALAMLGADGDFAALSLPDRAARTAALAARIRVNTYDAGSGRIAVSPERARAIEAVVAHYTALFGGTGDGPEAAALREAYAIPERPLGPRPDAEIRKLVAWWWWTAWAAVTLRPGDSVTYTNNWPHEPLVGNRPSAATFVWTFVSVVLLIAATGALCWFFLRERDEWRKDTEPPAGYPEANPIDTVRPTPSMRGVVKYIWIVAVLLALQIAFGAATAHFAVEGQDFYGLPLSEIAPYALTRTWHVQLAVLWIATAWLGAGLYLAPMIAGFEPRRQRLGVDALWVALVVAVLGSLFGEWLALTGRLTDPALVYWFGHQGYEFLDMGRFWQALIFAGLLIWLALMMRCLVPAIRRAGEDRHLLILLLLSSAGIALLFGAGFLYERDTHLTMAEYWRWWVVHLWVEGVFEVFATAWVAWAFVHMRLLRPSAAAIYTMFSAMIFLGGGVLGTFPPPVFRRDAGIGAGARRGVFGARGRAAGADRLRSSRPLAGGATGALGAALPHAADVLPGGRVLEPGRRGGARFPDQPAVVALLPAGAADHPGARSRGAVRGLRDAWHRPRPAVPPRPAAGRGGMVRPDPAVGVLAVQRRARPDGLRLAAAAGHHPGAGLVRPGLLVRARARPPAFSAHGDAGVAARAG